MGPLPGFIAPRERRRGGNEGGKRRRDARARARARVVRSRDKIFRGRLT